MQGITLFKFFKEPPPNLVCVYTFNIVCMENLLDPILSFPPCESRESDSGHQACWEVPVPVEHLFGHVVYNLKSEFSHSTAREEETPLRC